MTDSKESGERVFSPLIKDNTKVLKVKLNSLEKSVREMNLIEEILLHWVDSRRSITVGLNTYLPFPCIGLSFNEKGKDLALYSIPTEEVFTQYRGFQPLKENNLECTGPDGFRPHDEWFDKRNARLRIYADEKLGLNFASPQAIAELALSYALSSAGFARFEIFVKRGKKNEKFIKGSFIFLGKNLQSGWGEEINFSYAELVKYVEDSRRLQRISKEAH